jgi:arginine deiminase
MRAGARAEWHRLQHVLVHEPGIEVFFALLSPSAHLYERFFNHSEARAEHRSLAQILHSSFGVRVHHLGPELVDHASRDEAIFQSLVRYASNRLERHCTADASDLPEKMREALQAPIPLEDRDPQHLLDIAVLNPTIEITPEGVRTLLTRPLYNLYFMRDQQATTDRGMVQGRMGRPEREAEVDLCAIALNSLQVPPVHRIQEGRFEGGDFIPAGKIAFLGVGSRTNPAGAAELLSRGLGFDEVVLVHQPFHPLVSGYDPMIAMHLDTYFNIAADGVAVANPLLLQGALVERYAREGDGYVKREENTTLDLLIRELGFSCIEISTLEQLCYSSNFLCVRDGECVSPDAHQLAPVVMERLREKAAQKPGKYRALLAQAEHDYKRLISDAEFFPHKKEVYAHGLEMTTIHLVNATGGYGGAHCMTCVLGRR